MSNIQASNRRVGRISWSRMGCSLAGLLLATTACQGSIQAGRDLRPDARVDGVEAGSPNPSRAARFGRWVTSDFRSAVVTRLWPLLDSRTISRRYGFMVRERWAAAWRVDCIHVTLSGGEETGWTTLECSLSAEELASEWRLALAGRPELSGTLENGSRTLEVVVAAAMHRIEVRDGPRQVASLHADSLWIADAVEGAEREAVTAAIAAIAASFPR